MEAGLGNASRAGFWWLCRRRRLGRVLSVESPWDVRAMQGAADGRKAQQHGLASA
jgi:hypothetical protein